MKKIILSIICSFVLVIVANAQQWQWAYNEGGNSGEDIEVDPSGNIYLLATVNNSVYGTSALSCGNVLSVIAKHDVTGNIMWARGFGINAGGTSSCFRHWDT
jgi:hypothetical protein